jgi:phosphoribosylformylglycinamidine cyclo-ligase
MEPAKMAKVIGGIAAGCRQAGCALIGGENAEMPDMYKKGEYDLAGFCTGVVEKKKILDTKKVRPGDVAIGLASSGLHSNGFSLARKVLKGQLKKYARTLLIPTRIYVRPVLDILDRFNIKSIAHITGGAFYEKLPRALPKGCGLIIDKKSWSIPEIFRIIQKKGNVPEKEMYRTFNMGIGMVLIAAKKDAGRIINRLKKSKIKAALIGKVIKGSGVKL